MKLEDQRFTEKQTKRILAEATEREARDQTLEERTISYGQLVQIAQESQIDPKYLKVSTKQLVKETGGLERATFGRILGKLGGAVEAIFLMPTYIRKIKNQKGESDNPIKGPISLGLTVASLGVALIAYGANHNIEDIPYLLAMHLGVNLGSGLYEGYRYEKDKLLKEMNGDKKDR